MMQDVRTAAESVAKAVADMTPQEAQAELSKREADKMTRRTALAKIGLRAGLGVLAALSVDDLARLVAKRMEQQAGQNAAVDKVARELYGAGVSFATTPPSGEPTCWYTPDDGGDPYQVWCNAHPPGSPGPSDCVGGTVGVYCQADHYKQNCEQCCDGVYNNQCQAYDDSPFHVQKSNCKAKCGGLPSNPHPPVGYP